MSVAKSFAVPALNARMFGMEAGGYHKHCLRTPDTNSCCHLRMIVSLPAAGFEPRTALVAPVIDTWFD